MRLIYITLLLAVAQSALPLISSAQDDWPRSITAADGTVFRIYQLQPDSFRGNLLAFRAALSVTEKGKTEPVFGTFRALAVVETDKDNRLASILSANVLQVNFSVSIDPAKSDGWKETLECGIPGVAADIPLDELISGLDQVMEEGQISKGLNNTAPRIFIARRPSILVLIDGIPRFRRNRDWDFNVVANSPYTIAESSDGWFYLYGGRHWYIAPTPMGPYNHIAYMPPDMIRVQNAIDLANARGSEHSDTIREGSDIVENIIVSQGPAELIQTKGVPSFRPITGTSLLYASNSSNDIFLDSAERQYYLLISGRWYRSPRLAEGLWTYLPSDSLPGDFSRIPEGSPKDNVLACIAGTEAAREAVSDAVIPQTARIERSSTRAQVSFDGPPAFADIRGTHLQYAINTATMLLRYKGKYYCVDKGVWFISEAPGGAWAVCTKIPDEVNRIPPDCPVYSCKYVYIYEVTPDYVYTGYTGGYLNNFISGPTVVYGTGYYYPSWMGNSYYPRASTWGFGLWYNPWFSWCLNYDLGLDWLNSGIAWGVGYWTGGWWGPQLYRPPYIWHHFSGHGVYERDIRKEENVNYCNNIYRLRLDVFSQPIPEPIYSDKNGSVFLRSFRDGWMQRAADRWKKPGMDDQAIFVELNRLEQLRQRGWMRVQNFKQVRGVRGAGGETRDLLSGNRVTQK